MPPMMKSTAEKARYHRNALNTGDEGSSIIKFPAIIGDLAQA
jgi:hypothetical protein